MTISLSNMLADSLGSEAIEPRERLPDYSVDGVVPEVVGWPKSVRAVSETVSIAAKERKVVIPWGGGTQMALGNAPREVDLVLALGRLNRIVFHEPDELVASVEGGITLESLQVELAKKEQFLPIGAPIPSRATIGGILASNATGPSGIGYGTARDWLIGIKIVNAEGWITKSGGKVVKNVTGYDLNKLYLGSLGTLGVIVEATFKVAPLPQESKTLVATYRSLISAIDSGWDLLRQSFYPHALYVVNRKIIGRLPGLTAGPDVEAAVLARFDGRKAAVARKLDESTSLMRQSGARAVEHLTQGESATLWRDVTDLGWSEEQTPDLVTKVSIVPSHAGSFLAALPAMSTPGFSTGVLVDLGMGRICLLWWADGQSPNSTASILDVISRVRERTLLHSGHVVVERCPVEAKGQIDVWGDSLEGIEIMRRIKREFDPTGMLNPGRFVGGI